jgi:2'-5' RNA ligase
VTEPRVRRTGLVLLVPEADPVVGRWRDRYDPHAPGGVPAHVTVLYPWLPTAEVTPAEEAALAALIATHPPFTLTFAAFGRFPAALWLAPDPSEPVRRLTRAVVARWPRCTPYQGRFDGDHPHLTIADGRDPTRLTDVTADITPHLPLHTTITAVTLGEETPDGRWDIRRGFPLSG